MCLKIVFTHFVNCSPRPNNLNAVAERAVFVKDAAKLSVEICDGCEWRDGLGKIFFKGVFVNFTDRAELCSYRLDSMFGKVKLT